MEQSQPAVRGQGLLEWYEALISAALVLVLGGGIGNLIDRVLNGEVVDYINLLFMRFAVFNFADICVCVGVALWVLVIFLDEVHADDAASKEQ
jgi:signal peptidase II